MAKDIYYQSEIYGDVCIQHNGDVHHFSGVIQLVGFLQNHYGDDFNLIEVTEHNWHELHSAGVFDDQ